MKTYFLIFVSLIQGKIKTNKTIKKRLSVVVSLKLRKAVFDGDVGAVRRALDNNLSPNAYFKKKWSLLSMAVEVWFVTFLNLYIQSIISTSFILFAALETINSHLFDTIILERTFSNCKIASAKWCQCWSRRRFVFSAWCRLPGWYNIFFWFLPLI